MTDEQRIEEPDPVDTGEAQYHIRLTDRIAFLERSIASRDRELETMSKEIFEQEVKLAERDGEINDLNKELTKYRQEQPSIESLSTVLKSRDELVLQQEKELAEAKKREQQLNDENDDLLKSLDEARAEIESRTNSLKHVLGELAEAREEIARLKADFERQSNNREHAEKELEKAWSAIDGNKDMIDMLKKQLAEREGD